MYIEASNVFYMENLFIRVNLENASSVLVPSNFAGFKRYFPRGSRLPVVSWSMKVLACKRHVMDLNVGAENRWKDGLGHRHFILACDDLPTFSRALLWIEGLGTCLLPTMELSIIIGDQVGTVAKESHDSNTPTDGNPKELLSAATKNAASRYELEILRIADNRVKLDSTVTKDITDYYKDLLPHHPSSNTASAPSDKDKLVSGRLDSIEQDGNANKLVCEYMKGSSSTMINRIKEAKSRWSQRPTYVDNPRVRRLLEPLRLLYNVGNFYIDAPISEQYRLEIFTTLSQARPSIHDLFPAVSTALEEAVAVYDAEDMAFAIRKLKGVLDIMHDVLEHCGDDYDCATFVMTGRYTGLPFGEARVKIEYLIWNNLARANLSFSEDPQHVRTAWNLTQQMVEGRQFDLQPGIEDDECWHYNVYSLGAKVWEALDQLGEYDHWPRSHALRDIVDYLRKAVRQEPGNPMLERELQRRLKEQQEAEMVEDGRKTESDEGEVMSGHLTN